ncbi:MAG TPA: N,N-dimethylformamidase beta subunit family domain-containing protein [Gaiellaceae bacterium]
MVLRLSAAAVVLVAASALLATPGQGRPPQKRRHHPRAALAIVPASVRENALPGTPGWDGPLAPDGAVDVYASATDALPGDSVPLHVSTDPAAAYRVLVYRLGWYGGVGARQVACLPSCDGEGAGVPLGGGHARADGAWVAEWPVTDTLQVGADWTSGYYEIRALALSGPYAGQSANTFIVVEAPDSDTAMLMQVPVDTWQAYNAWGGSSSYGFPGLGRPLSHLSFDRPYRRDAPGAQGPLGWEYPFVRFVEANGYDVSYQSDVYTDAHPESLLRHRLVAVPGHSEYWTKTMRDAFDAARDTGVNLAFLGANAAYWQVKLVDGGRTLIAYKSTYDPEPNAALKTAMFRELIPPRYECNLIGIQHEGASPFHWGEGDYTVEAPDDPWFAGTGFRPGDAVKGIVSVESDTIPPLQPAGWSCGNRITVLFHRESGGPFDGNADATRYTAPSGAIVFASGSHEFAWGLDGYGREPSRVDARLQQFMRNALDELTSYGRRPRPSPR